MAWNRLYLKNWVKDRYGLQRGKNDGLLSDDIIHDCINDAIRQVADDCGVKLVRDFITMQANQWREPIPDDLIRIRSIWFIDSGGTYVPMLYVSPEQFLDYRDPATDTSSDLYYFAIADFQSKVFHFYANAAPVYDYISKSHVTSATIRTVIDTGTNFGKTLDGSRIEPGCIVQNLTDGSYGYVEVLDIITNKTTGTATSGSGSTILEDTTKNFTALGVAVNDIICTPSTGVVTSYAFVKTVGTTTITYENYQDPDGSTLRFASGVTYKIGKAQQIRLSEDTPHPGLRDGATNDFTIGDVLCTMTGTTFTATTVTGNSTTGAVEDAIAIASGGSHGQISAVTSSTVLTVDKWIGGTPTAGETVTVRTCDEYQVEGEYRTQRVLQIGPTPAESDTIGSESICVLYYALPKLPLDDDDTIEMDERYKPVLLKALEWKAAERWGKEFNYVMNLESVYKATANNYRGDLNRPDLRQPLTVSGNRSIATRYGLKNQVPSGIRYDI